MKVAKAEAEEQATQNTQEVIKSYREEACKAEAVLDEDYERAGSVYELSVSGPEKVRLELVSEAKAIHDTEERIARLIPKGQGRGQAIDAARKKFESTKSAATTTFDSDPIVVVAKSVRDESIVGAQNAFETQIGNLQKQFNLTPKIYVLHLTETETRSRTGYVKVEAFSEQDALNRDVDNLDDLDSAFDGQYMESDSSEITIRSAEEY